MVRCRRSLVLLVVSGLLAGANAGARAAGPTVLDLGGDQYRVEFTVAAPPGTRTVHLAGTFNGWNPTARALEGPDAQGRFRTSLVLPKGRHEYKFVLNGETWVTDADNPHKTPGYENAILFLGMPATSQPDAAPPPPPVAMAGIVGLPEDLKPLTELLADKNKADVAPLIEEWFAKHPMPLFTETSVTFVYADAKASEVFLQLAGYGARTGYDVRRLVEGRPVFAVSLDRAKLPERMAYTYDVLREGREESVLDPHAWSLTSRSNRPAALVAEASERRGRIEVIPAVRPSAGELKPRDVYVYLPPGYDRDGGRRYPVLYAHDGQNCWDDPTEPFGHGGWCINLTADRLINEKKIQPFIAVGVANTADRMREYGPGKDILAAADHPYLQFLKRDVKPLIDGKYRTQPDAAHTALMGSSMGGVVSLQGALLEPTTFGAAACLSPAFDFEEGSEQRYAELIKKAGKLPVRLYVDNGTGGRGQDGAPSTHRMVALLHETGWTDGRDFLYFEDTGAEHNERAWRARLDRPLAFLFGP
jgi:enterochelin esterase-like enzyme